MAKLTNRQKLFIDEYLIDLNATQAAIRAGYSVNSAHTIGNENLNKTYIKEQIEKKLAERSKRTGINAERIVNELAKIAFLNPTDVINMHDATIEECATREDTSTISSIKVKTSKTDNGESTEREVKVYDKLKALELLGKHIGMFSDKLKVEGTVLPVVISGEKELED